MEDGILMWGYRVVIPSTLRQELLKELHSTHMGSAKMKSLARSYFWWPNIDQDIEHYVKKCVLCLEVRSNPPLAKLVKWPESCGVFDRVHIDFLGPVNGKMFFILTDSFSKWPEIFEMSRTDSKSLIDKLREIFARFGLPNKIVSDNGPQFTSIEYKNFCSHNGIKMVTSPPFHPSAKGAADNAVKTFKSCLLKLIKSNKSSLSISAIISRYLFTYRNTPHWVTGECPSTIVFGRKIKTRFDLLKDYGGRSKVQESILKEKEN